MDSSDANSSFEDISLEQLMAQRQELMMELESDLTKSNNLHTSESPSKDGDSDAENPCQNIVEILQRMKSLDEERLTPLGFEENCNNKRKISHSSSKSNSPDLKRSRIVSVEVSACPFSRADIVESNSDSSKDAATCSSSNQVTLNGDVEEMNGQEEGEVDSDSDIDIEGLLEAPIGSKSKGAAANRPPAREKIVLKHKNTEYFEVIPDGWREITHRSGLSVYLHLATRVCTFGRPYFIGPGSVRNHTVPMAAIPCLAQKQLKEKLAENKEKKTEDTELSRNLELLGVPETQVQCLGESLKKNLPPEQLHDYAKSVFEFEIIKICRFDRWSEHRSHMNWVKEKNEKTKALLGRPTLPSAVKLITVPSLSNRVNTQGRQFFMNPQGKTTIAVLHEYVQKVLKAYIAYEFEETSNAAKPYSATVKLASKTSDGKDIEEMNKNKGQPTDKNDYRWVALGTGYGNSKKMAKIDAARKALAVLVPGIEFNEEGQAKDEGAADSAIKLFDMISVEDSRVSELSAKAGQPPPFLILQECLKRHSAFGDTTVEHSVTRLKHQKHEYKMTCAKHTVSVACSNKKMGKQSASQAMLAKLHPQITTWGALLRLYGYGAQKKVVDHRKQKDSIIKLQASSKSDLSLNEPNQAILTKLKQEMGKLFTMPQRNNVTGLSISNQTSKKSRKERDSSDFTIRKIDI